MRILSNIRLLCCIQAGFDNRQTGNSSDHTNNTPKLASNKQGENNQKRMDMDAFSDDKRRKQVPFDQLDDKDHDSSK